MGQKYRVVCLAITDKFGNMHRNQNITRDSGGNIHVEDVILDADMFELSQIHNYLEGGHIEPYNVEDQSSDTIDEITDDLQSLKEEYLELSGKTSVPGTWGIKKLTSEIEELRDNPNV